MKLVSGTHSQAWVEWVRNLATLQQRYAEVFDELPDRAQFNDFIVWCHAPRAYLGQRKDPKSGKVQTCYVASQSNALQFETFEEACEQANRVPKEAVILMSLWRWGPVIPVG